jgi:hypothetical protein
MAGRSGNVDWGRRPCHGAAVEIDSVSVDVKIWDGLLVDVFLSRSVLRRRILNRYGGVLQASSPRHPAG